MTTKPSLEKLCKVEQMGYLIPMYAVSNFDLPGKFHFVSLTVHILTLIPTGEPVNGCRSR